MTGRNLEEKQCSCGRTVIEPNYDEESDTCVFCTVGITG